jgi:serine/threonine protein kinase
VDDNAGRVVAGRYDLQRPLGRGGMATVYLAIDLLLDRPVAVKMLHPELARDDHFVARFEREARAAARLNHPHIAAIYDLGRYDTTHFIVMEYVPGPTLKELIQEHGPLPELTVLDLGRQIAGALATAHRQGVIHRDVKPHNVLVPRLDTVKVADFGIARAAGELQLTATHVILGSVHYASPEQLSGAAVDERSDLYSLGVVLYEALTAHLPFTGETASAIAWQQVDRQPPPLARWGVPFSPSTETLIGKALSKTPEDRFESAGEMSRAMERAIGQAGAPSTPTAPVDAPLARERDAEGRGIGPWPHGDTTMVGLPWHREDLPPTSANGRPKPPPGMRQARSPVQGPNRRRAARAIAYAIAAVVLPSIIAWAVFAETAPAPAVTGAPPRPPISEEPPVQPPLTSPSPSVATPASGGVTSAALPPPPTAVSAPSSPFSAAAEAVAAPPVETVSAFYAAIERGQLAAAASLWSDRMKSQYPPDQFLFERFRFTHEFAVRHAELLRVDQVAGRATVAVDLHEVAGNPPVVRRWVGTWDLIRGPSGWLLDEPHLSAA